MREELAVFREKPPENRSAVYTACAARHSGACTAAGAT